MTSPITTIKRRVIGKVSRMTPQQARDILAEIAADGPTIEHAAIRQLTGGFASQSINFIVCRYLGARARRPASN
jgi:CTP:molybdopterin cytidylyltransferase MocA